MSLSLLFVETLGQEENNRVDLSVDWLDQEGKAQRFLVPSLLVFSKVIHLDDHLFFFKDLDDVRGKLVGGIWTAHILQNEVVHVDPLLVKLTTLRLLFHSLEEKVSSVGNRLNEGLLELLVQHCLVVDLVQNPEFLQIRDGVFFYLLIHEQVIVLRGELFDDDRLLDFSEMSEKGQDNARFLEKPILEPLALVFQQLEEILSLHHYN